MRDRDTDGNFLAGLLIGIGATCAGLLIYDLGKRARQRAAEQDRLAFPPSGSPTASNRKIRRAERELTARVERMRSAGH